MAVGDELRCAPCFEAHRSTSTATGTDGLHSPASQLGVFLAAVYARGCPMLRPLLLSLAGSVLLLGGCAQSSKDPAPADKLLASVDIPYKEFKLDNGLRVLVHTDRKAPVVAVSIWYDVGS